MIIATHEGKYHGHDVEYSIVNVSELEGELRIDAEYYEPSYIKAESKILRKGVKFYFLNPIILHPTEIKRIYVDDEEDGIEMVMAQNIRNNELDFSQKFIMPESVKKILRKNKLRKFDILMTRTGANYGQTAPFLEDKEMYASADCLIIRINNGNILHLFLSTYFNTEYGQTLIKRVAYGLAQPHIAPSGIKSVAIPIPSDTFQKFIEKLVLKAYEERQKAEQLYKQAEEILLEELGLENWEPKIKKIKLGKKEFEEEENISIRMLSEVINTDRMDAEYWEPEYDEFFNKLKKKVTLKPIKEFLISKILKGIEVGSENYREKGIPFIRVSNMTKFGIVERDQKYISEEFYLELKDKFEPKEGEVLLTKDATPGIAYVLKENIKGIIASGIVRLKVKNIEKEYLALVINSIIGQIQILKEGGGSIISHWKPSQIENLLIPVLNSKIQQEISHLIQRSFEARENSKKLLEISKRSVEVFIEKDEKESLDYANSELSKLNIKFL